MPLIAGFGMLIHTKSRRTLKMKKRNQIMNDVRILAAHEAINKEFIEN